MCETFVNSFGMILIDVFPFFFQLALEYGIKFMETSAKANINVENVCSSRALIYCLFA